MKNRSTLNTTDQETLKKYLNYDKDTGVFTWKVRRANCIKIGDIAGTTNTNGHRQVRIEGKQFVLHRLAWLYVYGVLPDKELDHINGDKSDNRIENLREVSHGENMQNLPTYRNNTSGKIGVHYDRNCNKWIARISYKGERIILGVFTTFEESCLSRERAEERYNYHENHGREYK